MPNFSFSRISLFEKCPKAYHFKYILKKDEYFSTIEQHLGKSIHTAIEYAYQIRDEGYNASINSFIDTFNECVLKCDTTSLGERIGPACFNQTFYVVHFVYGHYA